MQKKCFHALVFALLSAISGQARAEEAGKGATEPGITTIDAQRLEIHLDQKMSAIGDAELHREGNAIFGDRIDYNLLNEEMHVVGNARIEQGGNIITGPELRIKLQEREGEMQEAVFTLSNAPKPTRNKTVKLPQEAAKRKTKQSHGDASLLIFDGPDREKLKDVNYTTCEVSKVDWKIHAKEMDLDHYTQTATATNATIEFKDVPILYTPWMDFSLNSQRKTGFISPTWATTSKSGIDITLPFYWNIAPNQDATISTRFMSKRGEQLQGEFRYLDEKFNGEDHLEYLPNDNTGVGSRFYVNLKHNQIFGNGWSGSYNFERVSDNQYFSDMTTHIITTSLVNLAQQAQINYGDDVWNFNALVQQFQTLDNLSYTYQRLPQLTLTAHKDWDTLTGNLYTQWVRFDRSSSAPATTDAVTGNRLTAYPSISAPFGNAFGYITPKIGMHLTKYALDGDLSNPYMPGQNYVSDTRVLPIFSVDSGMYFDRDFKVVKNAYTQTLEPRLFYVYIPHHDQSQLPVFDSAMSDLNLGTLFSENQFTGNDRINDANQVSLAATTRLIDAKTGIQRLAATIGQRFYFSDQRVTLPGGVARTENSSDIITAVTARLLNYWNIDAAWQYHTGTSQTDKANIGARYSPEPGKVLNLSYRYTRDVTGLAGVDQIDLSSEWPLGKNWYGLGRINYSFLNNANTLSSTLPNTGRTSGMIESLAGVEYDAGCWQGRGVLQRVSTATANANYAIFFQIELGGLTALGTSSPMDLLKRSIPGYSNSALTQNNLQ